MPMSNRPRRLPDPDAHEHMFPKLVGLIDYLHAKLRRAPPPTDWDPSF
jgi:hypothetical protein